MALTAAEQYAIELVNRARMDPVAEARRYGVGLNAGVTGVYETIVAQPMQVLAPNVFLDASATRHAQWMLDNDIFDHFEGTQGSRFYDPTSRMEVAGYSFGTGGWSSGENIALASYDGRTALQMVEMHHGQWMRSAGHRAAMLDDDFREIGYAQVSGVFTGAQSSAGVQNFAMSGNRHFVTGVVYNDRNGNDFYNIGEGVSGATFRVEGGAIARSAAAGGYGVQAADGPVVVQVKANAAAAVTRVGLDLSDGNVKLDLVSRTELMVSGDARLLSGPVTALTALGIDHINLSGSAGHNRITGNAGRNVLEGNAGADRLFGMGGNDRLDGGRGHDALTGGAGNDQLHGGLNNDTLTGGTGRDVFIFGNGGDLDRVSDFRLSQGDRLRLDDALWAEQGRLTAAQVVTRLAEVERGNVVLDFGGGDVLTLAGVTSLRGLAAAIDIF